MTTSRAWHEISKEEYDFTRPGKKYRETELTSIANALTSKTAGDSFHYQIKRIKVRDYEFPYTDVASANRERRAIFLPTVHDDLDKAWNQARESIETVVFDLAKVRQTLRFFDCFYDLSEMSSALLDSEGKSDAWRQLNLVSFTINFLKTLANHDQPNVKEIIAVIRKLQRTLSRALELFKRDEDHCNVYTNLTKVSSELSALNQFAINTRVIIPVGERRHFPFSFSGKRMHWCLLCADYDADGKCKRVTFIDPKRNFGYDGAGLLRNDVPTSVKNQITNVFKRGEQIPAQEVQPSAMYMGDQSIFDGSSCGKFVTRYMAKLALYEKFMPGLVTVTDSSRKEDYELFKSMQLKVGDNQKPSPGRSWSFTGWWRHYKSDILWWAGVFGLTVAAIAFTTLTGGTGVIASLGATLNLEVLASFVGEIGATIIAGLTGFFSMLTIITAPVFAYAKVVGKVQPENSSQNSDIVEVGEDGFTLIGAGGGSSTGGSSTDTPSVSQEGEKEPEESERRSLAARPEVVAVEKEQEEVPTKKSGFKCYTEYERFMQEFERLNRPSKPEELDLEIRLLRKVARHYSPETRAFVTELINHAVSRSAGYWH